LDIELVKDVLHAKYNVDLVCASIEAENSENLERNHSEHSKFWELVGVNEKSGSSGFSEIEDFLKLPRAKTDIDPLKWWISNRLYFFSYIF
jgi:hypothetical protein